jgi:hypothetical protein
MSRYRVLKGLAIRLRADGYTKSVRRLEIRYRAMRGWPGLS